MCLWEEELINEVYSAVEIHDETCFDSDDIARGERTLEFSRISKKSFSWDGNRYNGNKYSYRSDDTESYYRSSTDYSGYDTGWPGKSLLDDFPSLSAYGQEAKSYLKQDRFVGRGIIVNPEDRSTIINSAPVQVRFESLLDRPGMWKVFSSLNAEVTVGSVLVQNGTKRQTFRLELQAKKDRGLIQLIASDELKLAGGKNIYVKGYILNLYMYRAGSGESVSPSYISIHPETSQVYCPIIETQTANIILPKGSTFSYSKNGSMYKLDQHRSNYNEALCVYLLCYGELDKPVVMPFKSGRKLVSSNMSKVDCGAIFFSPVEEIKGDKWAVISDPLDTFTFVRNQCRGFVLRTTNGDLGSRTGALDKNKRLLIQSRDHGINTHTKTPFWELRVVCDRPSTAKLPIIIKNLYSNECEVL